MDAESEIMAPTDVVDGHPLDQVVWRALTSRQAHLAEGDEHVRRFPNDLSPFGAMIDFTPSSFRSLRTVLRPNQRIALVTPEAVSADNSFVVARSEPVNQMVFPAAATLPAQNLQEIIALGAADMSEMLALAAETQPGPFSPRILELGRYIGIRRDGKLVAMAGERMRLPGFTEISAVCVSGTARGRGFAAQVVVAMADLIRRQGETPFLHVFPANEAAFALYLKLGFTLRRTMRLTVLELAAVDSDNALS